MAPTVKETVLAYFKMHGLIIQRASTVFLVTTLQSIPSDDHRQWLQRVIDVLHQQNLTSAIVGLSDVEQAVSTCQEDIDDLGTDKLLTIIDAFSVPKYVYDQDCKKFVPADVSSRGLYGNASAKTAIFLDRYALVHQRLMRHDIFRLSFSGRPTETQQFSLKPIEYLLGTSSKLDDIIVLGMLAQLKESCYYLEDPTGHTKVDLSSAKFHSGLFTENCFVLVEGSYEDGVLQAKAVGLPPSEPSNITRSVFGSVNFFGGPLNAFSFTKLRAAEVSNPNASLVFVADIWLDDIKVMDKLWHLFIGFSDCPPTCFVFMGNFSSMQQDNNQPKTTAAMAQCFSKLVDMIHEFPSLVTSSKFIFVPGPLDPGLSTVLPRPPIPSCITDAFQQRLPQAVFTTNPCRFRYCTQEIVVFREDLVSKMCRNSVHFPDEGDVATHLGKTIASQNHLYPMPLHIAPIYWDYDHVMRLYPLPDLLVLGDRYDPFKMALSECNIVNPGSFSRNGYVFKVYVPALRQVEDSQIMGD